MVTIQRDRAVGDQLLVVKRTILVVMKLGRKDRVRDGVV